MKCHAFLEAYNKNPTRTSTLDLRGAYVIVGRGFAGTVNCATLLSAWGKRRVDRARKVVIAGYDDPWSKYVRHNMNQEVELQTLPGYQNRPELPPIVPESRWMDSRTFSKLNAEEVERLEDAFPGKEVEILSLGVVKIESIAGGYRFWVTFDNGDVMLARYVDLCTGTGQQTYAEGPREGRERGVKMSDALWQDYLNPRLGTEGWQPKVVSAEMYVTGDRQVIPGGSVLVSSANSPAGIQAGEHALCEDAGRVDIARAASEVVLIAAEKLNGGFLPIGRLDDLARTEGGPLRTRLHIPTEPLFPTRPTLWFGDGYRIDSIEVLEKRHRDAFCHADGDREIDASGDGKKLVVTFQKPAEEARFVQGRSDGVRALEPVIVYALFDQVVLSTGRLRGGRGAKRETAAPEQGSALGLIEDIWKKPPGLQLIKAPGYAFGLGLQTQLERLRILGAAGLNNPIFLDDDKRQLAEFEASLPVQARVNGEGVTLSAITIAIANRFFDKDAPNKNLNTATREELQRLLEQKPGRQVFKTRHWRVRPFLDPVDAYRATAYWYNYFKSDKILALNAMDPVQREARKAALSNEWPRILAHLNSPALLVDGVEWDKRKKALDGLEPSETYRWRELDFPESAVRDALIRYANYIAVLGDKKTELDP